MPETRIAVIGVPSSAGARQTGQEKAPAAFRLAGLVERLRAAGLDVEDRGDLEPVRYSADLEHPNRQNVALVAEVARQTAERVDGALADRRLPLVLGGDCTLAMGVVAGLLRHHQRLGLLYFDGDVDLNTPETTVTGILDGMVLAHLLGRGEQELVEIGPRQPQLSEEDVALLGYDPDSGWIDPPELELLERSKMALYPLERVREDPAGAAREAIAGLEDRDAILVHFDVDVTNLPAGDLEHPRGLELDAALAALRVLVASPRCAAVTVTELNTERDPDLSQTRRVTNGLVEALAGRS